MAKGVFSSGVQSIYDDLPEVRCQFPQRYLKIAKELVGDWIVYYEPRNAGGKMVYFATARVAKIEPDPNKARHYYLHVADYLEFPTPVPFRIGETYFETVLQKEDGSPNKGAFGWALRRIPESEYSAIVHAGMNGIVVVEEGGDDLELKERPVSQILVSRRLRDRAFTERVKTIYAGRCCFSGLKIVDLNKSTEVEAAHIVGVCDNGPDAIRNGIALSRTFHWMFDHGLMSLEDTGKILTAEHLVPDRYRSLLNDSGLASLPNDPRLRPHPTFLQWHRRHHGFK